jgi:hypothetical protein
MVVVAMVLCGLVSLPSGKPDHRNGAEDLRCYLSIVERIRSGEGYYQAAYRELTSRGYPTGSTFNWRPPLLGWVFGQLPDLRFARAAAILLSLLTVWLWIGLSSREVSFGKVATGSFLLLGMPIYSFLPDIYLSHEYWAGALITLSIFSYAKKWRWLAVTAGLLALLIRELAFPFVAAMALLSVCERKFKESLIWAAGILAFFAMMAIHSVHIKEITALDNAYRYRDWLAFGGWTFILNTSRMHPYLFLLPSWLTAALVPMALLGLSGWKGPFGTRIGVTVGIYICLFLFIGQPFNRYWGVLYANLLLLGFLNLPEVSSNLYRSAVKPIKSG